MIPYVTFEDELEEIKKYSKARGKGLFSFKELEGLCKGFGFTFGRLRVR